MVNEAMQRGPSVSPFLHGGTLMLRNVDRPFLFVNLFQCGITSRKP
jgi:hypothetical protein